LRSKETEIRNSRNDLVVLPKDVVKVLFLKLLIKYSSQFHILLQLIARAVLDLAQRNEWRREKEGNTSESPRGGGSSSSED
jgi:hypothetical protein